VFPYLTFTDLVIESAFDSSMDATRLSDQARIQRAVIFVPAKRHIQQSRCQEWMDIPLPANYIGARKAILT
jgi:hypothetical protein